MYRFETELWEYQGEAPWHFVTLPEGISDEIRARTAHHRKAFGSVAVEVTIGATRWSTSLFPDSKTRSYVLPVKKRVRSVEGLTPGDIVDVEVGLRE